MSLADIGTPVLPPDAFARRLTEIRNQHRAEFIRILRSYDGSREAFSTIIRDALGHTGVNQCILATLFRTTPATISRWARGAAPSHLARVSAVHCIQEFLEVQTTIGDVAPN